MQNIDVSQAQALLPSLLEAVLKKGDEIIFTHDEQPVARLSSVNKSQIKKTIGKILQILHANPQKSYT